MKIQDWFENWGITGLKLKVGFLEMDWQPQPEEQQAAWELYIELLTRVTTQEASAGHEAAALASIHKLFGVTRQLLKEKGRKSETFAKIAIVILNQKIRPFTTGWHKQMLEGGFDDADTVRRFWRELRPVQQTLCGYAGMLAEIAGVEDFQDFQDLAGGPLETL